MQVQRCKCIEDGRSETVCNTYGVTRGASSLPTLLLSTITSFLRSLMLHTTSFLRGTTNWWGGWEYIAKKK